MMHNSENAIKLHRCFIKNYKKNTLAVFFSFALTFMLLTAMLSLIHTNHKISNIQAKAEFSPSDCFVDGLSKQQLEQLQGDNQIEKIAIQQGEAELFERNNQQVFLTKNDSTAITMMSKVIDGRIPEKKGEVAAEKWVLLNLGIEPVVDQKFKIKNADTGEVREFKLAGLLSDVYGNKKYGLLNLYTAMDKGNSESYLAYLEFCDNVNYDDKVKELQSTLGIQKRKIRECPARENLRELYFIDIQIVSVILLICMVVFYGVYRIAAQSRMQQYGILRAIGMKKGQLQKMILLELYQIYLVSVPIGIAIGLFLAHVVMVISGDRDTEIYLYNETVRFELVVPIVQILICIAVTFLMVGFVGYMVGRRAANSTVIETISGNFGKGKGLNTLFDIQEAGSKTDTLFAMGCKYIFRDLTTSGFVILTICLGVTLFTGLAYKAKTLELYREDTKEAYYLNGQYAMTMQYFDHVNQGVSRQSIEELKALEQIKDIKTSSGLPIRVIDDAGIERNEDYYNESNERLEAFYGYGDAGFDGTDQVYKSILLGYNQQALQALEQYVIEGNFQYDRIEEDEVILCVLSTNDRENNSAAGWYKNGKLLMEYHAGDEISVKYRADLQTDREEYEAFMDFDSEYVYKTYKIAAIVAFPYMYECNRTIYPLLITDDRYIKEIAPKSKVQCVYLDGNEEMGLSEQIALEQRLIQIGSRNRNISTRSLISEIKQNEMFYHKQMVYIYGIAMIAFVLVMINMINNLKYRMQTRTKEICMLRVVGMSVAMTRRMMLFENLILCIAAIAAAFVLSQPTLRYLYKISDMQIFGHLFSFDYTAFLSVSAAALVICVILSFGKLKEWKTRKITEGIGSFE